MKVKVWLIILAVLFLFSPVSNSSGSEKGLLSPIEIKDSLPPVLRNGQPDATTTPDNRFNEKDSDIVYMVTDVYEKYAWFKIDGQILNLKLDESKSEKVISYLKEKEGDHFRLVYSTGDVEAVADYLVTMVGEADDCIRTGYMVRLKVTKAKRTQFMTLVNERGC